jgi:inorganic pyrophosphatase
MSSSADDLIPQEESTEKNVDEMEAISAQIGKGSDVFLFTEYIYLLVFVVILALLIFFFGEKRQWTVYTTMSFLTGALTSMLCGFIGMKIAVSSNYRTTYSAFFGLGESFKTAYYGACVMGFGLVSLSLIILLSLILIYKAIVITKLSDYRFLFEVIAGYGLGGSSVALFCRVGGGIYTKAADVGADLVAKLEFGYEEDDPKNPACIADNVGDNVGDIAGMGADLFGSMAESLCASLLVGATSDQITSTGAFLFPLLIIACSIFVCIITAVIGLATTKCITTYESLEWSIKFQLIISSVLIIPVMVILSLFIMPATFNVGEVGTVLLKEGITNKLIMVCPILGLVSGLLIGISTEYYTSLSYSPVAGLVEGCKKGTAINIILGLSLGYLSNVIPTILIAITIVVSYYIASVFGISLAAIGMLSNLPICLAIDSYGPISDNAGGISSMCLLPDSIREVTDKLDSAGNTTAAIGKGFAIGSACLVALSLFGAFLTNTKISNLNMMTPIMLASLTLGAMVPYLFSALTMRAVGKAAEKMVEAVRDDFFMLSQNANSEAKPDSEKCIKISTDASINQMFLPGAIVIFVPMIMGVVFGPTCVAGILMGTIVSGIQLAISMANSGGAWDNCKKSIKNKGLDMKYSEITSAEIEVLRIELGKVEENIALLQRHGVYNLTELTNRQNQLKKEIETIEKEREGKTTEEKEMVTVTEYKKKENLFYARAEGASISGDTVGDPLKDTSGPSLNILIKLSSILSVVFSPLFLATSFAHIS